MFNQKSKGCNMEIRVIPNDKGTVISNKIQPLNVPKLSKFETDLITALETLIRSQTSHTITTRNVAIATTAAQLKGLLKDQ